VFLRARPVFHLPAGPRSHVQPMRATRSPVSARRRTPPDRRPPPPHPRSCRTLGPLPFLRMAPLAPDPPSPSPSSRVDAPRPRPRFPPLRCKKPPCASLFSIPFLRTGLAAPECPTPPPHSSATECRFPVSDSTIPRRNLPRTHRAAAAPPPQWCRATPVSPTTLPLHSARSVVPSCLCRPPPPT
jgi:hypothetical protein